MNDLSGDFTLDDSDIAATVAQHRLRQTVQVNAGLDGNPDDAAEAADLGNMTGDPPALIMANQDEYTKRLRQQTAQALVLNNPALITYIQSHPLAATVSADDWGNLNKFTRESVGLSGLLEQLNARLEAPADTIGQRAVEGAVEGWRSADMSDEFARYEDPTGPAGKFGAAAAKAGYGAVNLLLQSMSAGMGLASGAARGVGETIGGPRLGRELAAMTEFELTRGDQPIGEHGPAPVVPTPTGKILAAAKPWIDAGEEPPRYVHPDIDAAKAELNAKAVEELEKSLANVQASATHERSPEMMATLIGGEFGDRAIGIHGDAALALYGDKAPAPDDGLLGWVPGIEAQLAEARDVGSDINIPLKDWLAKVDPAVAKGLHDDLRMWPGGITAREMGEVEPAVPPKTTVEEPLPQIRAAAELEPKFSWGDRKITLLSSSTPEQSIEELQTQRETINRQLNAHDRDYNDKLNAEHQRKLEMLQAAHTANPTEDTEWDLERHGDRPSRDNPDLMGGEHKELYRKLRRVDNSIAAIKQREVADKVNSTLPSGYRAVRADTNRYYTPEWDDMVGFPEKRSSVNVVNKDGGVIGSLDSVGDINAPWFQELVSKGASKTAVERALDAAAAAGGHPEGVTDLAWDRNKSDLENTARGIEESTRHSPEGGVSQFPEPKLSVGDRKITLAKGEVEGDRAAGGDLVAAFEGTTHDQYQMMDETGKPVGELSIVPGSDRTLLVNWVGGQAGLWANSFGPALIRDLKRQLKVMYPDYDYITGYRVSGARTAAGDQAAMPFPKVKLDEEAGVAGHQRMQDILANGWERFSSRIEVNRQGVGAYDDDQLQLGQIAADEINRLTGGRADVEGVAGIRRVGSVQTVRGMYAPAVDRKPTVMFDLLGPDPVGTGRHESVHMLRDYGLVTPDEWGVLDAAAHSEGWLDRYGINERYGHLDDDAKTEEAVAEGFREWAAQAPEVRPKTGVGAVFQKIMDFFDRVRRRFGEALGHEPTWEEVFQRIHSGEAGAREPQAPLTEGAFKFSEGEDPVQGLANLQAKTVGLPAAEFMKLRDRLIEQQRGDIEKAMRRATAEQEKRQGKEWRENRAEMAAEVSKEIHRRPDVAADLFLGSGEVDGVKLKQRYTLRAEDLTPEQTAALPEHYVSKNGLPADYVAGMFGYGSRGELVENLAKLEAAKRTANGGRMQPMEFMNRLVRGETERRMEAKYGDLAKNVLEDARDQAVSEGSINVLHQELMVAAQQAGVTAFDKDVMRTAAQNLIAETTLGKLSSYRLMQEMGRHGREATKSVLAGDYATATTALTKQTLTAMVAAEARKVEKEVVGFDKLAKQMAKREQKTMAPEFTNWVHDTLMRVGKTVRRSPEDLVREIEASGTGKTLEDFVGYQTRWGGVLGVADQLLDPAWRNGYKELTVAEFRGVNDSVRSLVKAGKDERKVLLAGEMEDLDALRPGFAKGLKEFPVKPFDVEGEVKKPGLVRYAWAQVLQAETVLNRWDKFDRKGTWNQAFFRPLVEGVNQIAAWEKEMAATLRAITNRPLPKRSVENTIFREPINGELRPMNEENLRTVMLNQGSRSNAERFAGSWKLKPEQVMEWVNRHATKEDWEFVQGVWDALKKPSEWSSNMYRSMSAVPMKLVEPREVETPFGKMAGGYYPLINHPEYEGKHSTLSGISDKALFGDGYSNGFMPGAGYKIERTRNYTPVAMTMDQLPQRIKQQIRDAALRPGLKNAAKIVRDPQIRDLVKRHYGTEYVDMLEGYLRNIANVESRGGAQSRATQVTSGALEFVRQNLIATLVGLNPGTVMKHAPTALMLSVNEVGGGRFLRAVREMFEVNDETGENGYGFAMGNSLELQRRSRNWKENLFGASADLQGRGKWSDLRNTMMELSSKPVALSDLASAVPTWLAGYRKSVEEGMSHGDAVYYADQSVRWAHGSTAETTRPMVSNRVSPWFTSLYNFFNDVLNRAVETTWRAGEMVGAAKDGDWPRAKAQVAPVAGGLFCAAIWPAIVEQLVSPVETSKDESTAVRLGKAGAHTIAAMFPIIRDFVQYATGSDSPDVGLFSEAYKAAGEFGKDFGKREPFSPAHAEKMIRDAGTFAGLFTGAPGMQVGRWAGGGYGLATGQEHPQGPWGWLTMARFGTTKGHAETMEDWLHGRARRR